MIVTPILLKGAQPNTSSFKQAFQVQQTSPAFLRSLGLNFVTVKILNNISGGISIAQDSVAPTALLLVFLGIIWDFFKFEFEEISFCFFFWPSFSSTTSTRFLFGGILLLLWCIADYVRA